MFGNMIHVYIFAQNKMDLRPPQTILSFKAHLVSKNREDILRKFIVNFFVYACNSVSIHYHRAAQVINLL